MELFDNQYQNKRVLVTGHTGFKGSWLCLWLQELGATVFGYSLAPETTPNHFDELNLSITSVIGNVCDREHIAKVVADFEPDIVFHLAAQSLVRRSYTTPVETFATNVMGTVNVLDVCRLAPSVQAVVNVTTDKCYENKEWVWGYRESDRLGGHDPYSTSKACSEWVSASYRQSFDQSHLLIATARAGNVVGGGDWAEDRLIPDLMKAAAEKSTLDIRNPEATRPWQHVLEPLRGYLMLGQRLLGGHAQFASAWNFGPNEEGHLTVRDVVAEVNKSWSIKTNMPKKTVSGINDSLHEAVNLKLDCSKARSALGWRPVWSAEKTFAMTTQWYRVFYAEQQLESLDQLRQYVNDMSQLG